MTKDRSWRHEALLVALCAAFAVSVWYVITQIRSPSGLWPADGFLAAAIFYARGWRVVPIVVFCAVFEFFCAKQLSSVVWLPLVHAQWDMTEGLLAAVLARKVLGQRGLLRTPVDFLRLQCLALGPASLLATLGFILECMAFAPGPDWARFNRVALAHCLGMATVMPAMLLLIQPALPNLRRSWRETAAVLAGVALLIGIVMHRLNAPALAMTPALLFAAFRLGPRGAAMSVLIMALLILPLVVSGGGPFQLHPSWSYEERSGLYQIAIVSVMFSVVGVSFLLAQQARLRLLLERRAVAARAARRRAIEASRAKTDFLATMSHEVRTPMNSILGFTTVLLADETVGPAARARVGMIAKAGQSLMALLDDILDFSKAEAGQIDLMVEPVDVAAMSRDVIDMIAPMAEAKGLVVRFETAPAAEGRFLADALRLRQVLLNLLNNAVKFTAEGEVRLTLRRLGGGSLRFEVADSGIGIHPDLVPRLFTRFSQADSSISRRFGGTGLGLAICKSLIERMGGTIGVESRSGAGSTFWFEVPLEPANAPPAAEDWNPAPAMRARVLLVDDHPVNRQLGQALLEILGCQVQLAEDGEEAVRAASQGGFDAILMDVHMPGMDGLAASRAILAMGGKAAQQPIIALSADVLPHNIALCHKAGMVDHVPKPIQLEVLHAVLQRHVARMAPASAKVA